MTYENDAFVGNIFFERGDGASPEVFTRVCQIFSISGLGEKNDLAETTTFCSGGFKEYTGGLADGEEVTVEGNYEQGDVTLLAMIADVKAKANRNYQVVVEDSSPHEVFSFTGVPLGWTLNPVVDARNTMSFTFKISGEVTVA